MCVCECRWLLLTTFNFNFHYAEIYNLHLFITNYTTGAQSVFRSLLGLFAPLESIAHSLAHSAIESILCNAPTLARIKQIGREQWNGFSFHPSGNECDRLRVLFGSLFFAVSSCYCCWYRMVLCVSLSRLMRRQRRSWLFFFFCSFLFSFHRVCPTTNKISTIYTYILWCNRKRYAAPSRKLMRSVSLSVYKCRAANVWATRERELHRKCTNEQCNRARCASSFAETNSAERHLAQFLWSNEMNMSKMRHKNKIIET